MPRLDEGLSVVRVLVVGAGGFLGTHVVRHAHDLGMNVVTSGRTSACGEDEHVVVDLVRDTPERIAAVLDEIAPDAVVNCAGATTGTTEEMADANVSAVFALLAAIAVTGWRGRFVHLGSSAEYGRTPEGSSVPESAPAHPVGVYGATKLGGTQLVELARQHGHDAVVLRIFNPLGIGAPPTSLPGRLLAEIRRAVRDGGPIRLGPLSSVRDFVDVRDVADAVVATVVASAVFNPVLNIGSGQAVPARWLVDDLRAISGCASDVVEDAPASSRSAEVPWQQADITLAGSELGWKPTRDLHSTLTDWWKESE